jgi:hypothetical protein
MMALYAEITSIEVVSSAPAGSRVDVRVTIKNKASVETGIKVGGALEYGVTPWPGITFPNDWANFPPGQSYYFDGYFTMPDKAVTVHAYSYWYGADGTWHFDDEKTKSVALAEVFKGTISRKELEYDSARASIPASNIPKDKSGLVHIWGRNDMSTTQQMGIYWILYDPSYTVRETYSAWEAWPYTSPGSEHEFIGGRFSLDKSGTWLIYVYLYMNPSNPTIVDSYSGTLCSVIATQPTITEFKIEDFVKA